MKVFKTERIIYFNAKYMIKTRNNKEKTNTNNSYYFQTIQENKERKEIITPKSLKPKKYNLFKVENYDDYFENEFKCSKIGRWTLKEHIRYLQAIDRYGLNWKKIKKVIKTRTSNQIRSHNQKFLKKIKQCKDEDLGIDFTLDSIHNMKDVIKHIRSVNNEFDVVNVLLYMSEKCYTKNKPSNKLVEIEKELNINNLFNDDINAENVNIKNNMNDDEKEKNNRINEEMIVKGLTPNNQVLMSNMNFINNYLEILLFNYLNNAIITNIIGNINNNAFIYNNFQNLYSNDIQKDLMIEKSLVNHPLNDGDNWENDIYSKNNKK